LGGGEINCPPIPPYGHREERKFAQKKRKTDGH